MLQSWTTPLPATALNRYDNVPAGGVAAGVQSGELAAVPDQVLAGDFDGDGQTDLAVLATTADGTTYSSLSGCSTTSTTGSCSESPRPVSWGVADCLAAPPPTCVRPLVTTGDINGDGRDDITVIGGQATGAASTETDVTTAGPRLSGILAGDVNGDGLTDEVSVAMASDSTVEVRTYLGAEDGLLTRLAPVTVSVADVGLKHLPADGWRLADVTGDHQADLVNLPAGARYGVILLATSPTAGPSTGQPHRAGPHDHPGTAQRRRRQRANPHSPGCRCSRHRRHPAHHRGRAGAAAARRGSGRSPTSPATGFPTSSTPDQVPGAPRASSCWPDRRPAR